jgi:glycosyltransferase involved in cell wall biosynthesis
MNAPTRPDRPLVSILVPSYNQGRFLGATLDSILAQDYRPLEIVVMDGASKDESVDVLRKYADRHPEIRWRSEPDKGVADAVNKCLAEARGVFAGIQSSDDLYRPGAISEAVAELERDPELALVCGDAEHIDADGRFLVLVRNRIPFSVARFLSRSLFVHQSSAFFRLDRARQVGGWNDAYFCADAEMWLRMMFRFKVNAVDRVWSSRRLHDVQRDNEASEMWDAWGRMIADSPDVQAAGWRVRRAAAAGRRMMAIYYNPRDTNAFPVLQAWLAILTYPPSFWGVWPKNMLIPRVAQLRTWRRRRVASRG